MLTQRLNGLFRHCSHLRNEFQLLDQQAETIQEISMNAAVASGHTGSHYRVFNEVATQVARTSQKVRRSIEQMRSQVNGMVSLTLQCQILIARRDKYRAARPGVADPKNPEIVQGCVGELSCRIHECLKAVAGSTHPIEAQLRGLELYQYRLFGALGHLRVESHLLSGQQQQTIFGLADRLHEVLEAGFKQVAELRSGLCLTRRINGQALILLGVEQEYEEADAA